MGKIQLLDNSTIQKIAAGEVIERPSSIVKELIENSLDANSRNITVEINQGGKSYIRVTDDGDGIDEDDIHLAFERHSTSKLRKIDDLTSILTMGFRGEALASIGAVSKVEILTKTSDCTAGSHAVFEDGKIKNIDRVGTPKGTTMIIKDLFYNLPVRKKFLKSDMAEGSHVSDMVYKLALGNYNTSFKLIRDNKVVLRTLGNGNIKENIYTILGKDISKGLIPVEFETEGIQIRGYISDNSLYRSNRAHQYLYVNGRYIISNLISNAIEKHYKSLIPLNRFPLYVLYIHMNPEEMDVNIHPTKQEIKFSNGNNIVELISNIIRDELFPSLSIPVFKEKEKENTTPKMEVLFNDSEEKSILVRDYTELDLSNVSKEPETVKKVDYPIDNSLYKEEKRDRMDKAGKEIIEDNFVFPEIGDNRAILDSPEKPKENELVKVLDNLKIVGVVFSTYIIAEEIINSRIYFIDQHAAHERVMYEKYRNEFSREAINTQQLLTPEILNLTNSEYSTVKANLNVFNELGFDMDEFGTNSFAIRGVPFIFGKPNIKNLFMDILDNINDGLRNSHETRLDKIMKLACTSAIKAGDSLSTIEIKQLLKDLSNCESPYTCPHGRPTIVEMTKRDMEKQFLRII